jgi:hypothetical protein
MRVKAMVLMVSLGAITATFGPESIWAMPQQNDVKTDAGAATAAKSTQGSAKTNWTPSPVSVPSGSDERDSSASRWNFKNYGMDIVGDQKDIWTSPAKVRFSDANWLIPAAMVSAGLFATDHEFSRHLSSEPQTIQRYRDIAWVHSPA